LCEQFATAGVHHQQFDRRGSIRKLLANFNETKEAVEALAGNFRIYPPKLR
jgi:hypothetical protein